MNNQKVIAGLTDLLTAAQNLLSGANTSGDEKMIRIYSNMVKELQNEIEKRK